MCLADKNEASIIETNKWSSYYSNDNYNWENPPEFVCLVGDADGSYDVPTYWVGQGGGDWGAFGARKHLDQHCQATA